MNEWGVDMEYKKGGALKEPEHTAPAREVYLLKRSKGKHGANLGKNYRLDTSCESKGKACEYARFSYLRKNRRRRITHY